VREKREVKNPDSRRNRLGRAEEFGEREAQVATAPVSSKTGRGEGGFLLVEGKRDARVLALESRRFGTGANQGRVHRGLNRGQKQIRRDWLDDAAAQKSPLEEAHR